MRANPAEFELVAPSTLPAVLSLLAQDPGAWLPIAGGTDLMVQYSAGKLTARKLVSIWNLPELRRIEDSPDELQIGAGCTYTDLRAKRYNQSRIPVARPAPQAGLAESPTKTAALSAAISSTLRPPLIRSPRFSPMTPNCSSFPPAANAAFLTPTSISPIAKPSSRPMNSFAPSA